MYTKLYTKGLDHGKIVGVFLLASESVVLGLVNVISDDIYMRHPINLE